MACTRRDRNVPACHLDGNVKTGVFDSQFSLSRTVMLELAYGALDAAVLELTRCVLDAVSISDSAVLELARGGLDADGGIAPFSKFGISTISKFASVLSFLQSNFRLAFSSFLSLRLPFPFPSFLCGGCGIRFQKGILGLVGFFVGIGRFSFAL